MAIKYPAAGPILQASGNLWSRAAMIIVVREVEKNLSGRVLKARTRRLLRSIKRSSKVNPNGFDIGTDQGHGVAWEKGYTRPEYIIKAVPFPQGLRRVKFDRRFFPARPWLKPAGKTKEPQIRALFAQTVGRAFTLAFPDQTVTINMTFK